MTTDRRPSLADRTMSSPLMVTTSSIASGDAQERSWRLGLSLLTPPASPRHSRSSSDLLSKVESTSPGNSQFQARQLDLRPITPTAEPASIERTEAGALICPYDVEILKDQRGRNQAFGQGAWSTVFKGTCHQKSPSGLATPPLSPASTAPALVAVKKPARKDAKKILESEALILTHLGFENDCDRFIIPFYGLVPETSSLVLTAIPLSLEEHIKKSAASARVTRTTWNMTEPVIGTTTVWLDLAHMLVSALSWMHEQAMVVHGDIKPGNILLKETVASDEVQAPGSDLNFPYQPLFADFSSSQRLDSEPTPNTLSAITREYTAPELLSSKVLSNPESAATTASDVFSLAVTLLVAATGNTMVYSGSVFQRQAMATQGWMVIQAVRNGPLEEAARVPRQGVVERALDRAVLRDGMGRIDAVSWMARIQETMQGEPTKS